MPIYGCLGNPQGVGHRAGKCPVWGWTAGKGSLWKGRWLGLHFPGICALDRGNGGGKEISLASLRSSSKKLNQIIEQNLPKFCKGEKKWTYISKMSLQSKNKISQAKGWLWNAWGGVSQNDEARERFAWGSQVYSFLQMTSCPRPSCRAHQKVPSLRPLFSVCILPRLCSSMASSLRSSFSHLSFLCSDLLHSSIPLSPKLSLKTGTIKLK